MCMWVVVDVVLCQRQSCLTPKSYALSYGTTLFLHLWRPQTHNLVGWSNLFMIQKAWYMHIRYPGISFLVTHVDNWRSQTNSTISIRNLYRMRNVVYPWLRLGDGKWQLCCFLSDLIPDFTNVTDSTVESICSWCELPPLDSHPISSHHLPFTMLLDSCIIILFPFSRFNGIDLQMNGLSHPIVKYNLLPCLHSNASSACLPAVTCPFLFLEACAQLAKDHYGLLRQGLALSFVPRTTPPGIPL